MAIKKSTKKMQPSPPKRTYTAKDSAQYEAIGKRFDTNVKKFTSAPTRTLRSGDQTIQTKAGLPYDLQGTIRKQADSMMRNPYHDTAKERFNKAKSGGLKGTKSAPKKATAAPSKKTVATKKPMMKSTKK
jgi:hypothetical protein